ncbi:MAG TPA: hypothetical protein VFA27_14135 [Vicinamibacterales bacterium]|nr:hypothetical protein [Vicinamibacterales bacterium]
MRALRWPCLLAAAVLFSSCGPSVDLSKGLQVAVVDTGWYDMGVINGQTKLVPSVTFKLKNVSDQNLVSLQVNALFRRVTEKDEWGANLVTAAGSGGLPPGQETQPFTVRSPLGYTGSDQSRQEMLANSHFVDAKVELLAKYGSTQWKRIGEFPIKRVLIEKQPGQ